MGRAPRRARPADPRGPWALVVCSLPGPGDALGSITVPPRVVAVIQARMSSKRLPGKVLLPLAGRPVLWHIVERLKRCKSVGAVVVATSVETSDDAIAAACTRWGVALHRGSLDDVLGRFVGALQSAAGDCVVRMPADKPLLLPSLVDRVVLAHLASDADYTSNMSANWPDDTSCIHGFEVEVASAGALERAAREAVDASDRTHVMPYLYARGHDFRVERVSTGPVLGAHHPRLSLDTKEDYELIAALYDALFRPGEALPDAAALTALFDARPDLVAINEHVRQRGYP